MSDELETELETGDIEPAATVVKIVTGKKYTATLVNGETYYLGNLLFRKNVPVVVSAEHAAILQTKFISQSLMNPDETFSPLKRKRFVIAEAPASEVVAKAPTVTRVRQRPAE